jgi:hypothetical protein
MILIDYDGMYVPELRGQKSTEGGNINFQHPGRNGNHFGPELDRFTEILIFLALKALSLRPDLYQTYGLGGEGLLFTQNDLLNPVSSKLLTEFTNIPSLKSYGEAFKQICQTDISRIPTLKDFLDGCPIEVSNTEFAQPVPQYVVGPWPIDASYINELMNSLDENVVVIGKISKFRQAYTKYNDPYVFLNVGFWPQQTFTVVMWSDVLDMMEKAGKDPVAYEGHWVSVSGIIGSYQSKPQIVLESPTDIAIISEAEAIIRLSKKNATLPERAGSYPDAASSNQTRYLKKFSEYWSQFTNCLAVTQCKFFFV